jgi:hypothetical protein
MTPYILSDNRAISSVNLLKNAIPVEQAQELVKIMQSKEKLTTLCGLSGNEATLDFSNQGLGPGDAVLIANDIRDNGALSKLVMRQNDFHGAEAGKVFSNMLAQNTVLKELDLSSQKAGDYGHPLDAAFVKEFAVGTSDNRAMTSLNLASNHIVKEEDTISPPRQGLQISDIVDEKTVTTIYDNGNIRVTDLSGILTVVNAIKDMRALTSLHVGTNNIPEKEMREIIAIAMRKDSMKMLCEVPFKDKTLTELDLSGKNLGMEGALVVVDYLEGNGALTKLDISSNHIGAEQEGGLQRICVAGGIELAK